MNLHYYRVVNLMHYKLFKISKQPALKAYKVYHNTYYISIYSSGVISVFDRGRQKF